MKIKTLARYLLIILAIGTPGFTQFDISGRTHEFGLINAQSLTRIAVFSLTGLLFFCLATLKPSPASTFGAPSFNRWKFYMLSYYGMFLVFSAMALSLRDFAVAGYRIAEWVLVISLCWYYFQFCQASKPRLSSIGNDFLSVVRIIVTVAAVAVWAGTILFPHLAYSYSDITGTYRLGGYLYGPNSLGVLCGIGSILFWALPRRSTDKIWSVVLFITMILTYSRGAIIGFITAILFHFFVFSSFVRKLAVSSLLIVCSLFYLGLSDVDPAHQFLSFLSRGESVESLQTLNTRTEVWDISLKTIADSPWIGKGFIQGPKTLGKKFTQDWWAPPHAHNDILNAGVAGGIFLMFLTFLIYLIATSSALRLKLPHKMKTAILAILIQCGVYSALTPVFSHFPDMVGVIMISLIAFLSMHSSKKSEIRMEPRHAYSNLS